MDIIEFLGYMVFGFLMYKLIVAWATLQHIKHAVRDAVEQRAIDDARDRSRTFKFEHVEQGPYNVVLVFAEDNKFLLQANTLTEAKALIAEKYPNIVVSFVDVKSINTAPTPSKIATITD